MKKIAVIIPAFQAPQKLEKCLAALNSQHYRAIEIFVRDNSDDNILFTAAINEGLNKFCFRDDIEYVLVLNQDAYLEPDTLSRLVDCMESQPTCGIACPLHLSEDGTQVSWGGSYNAFPKGRHQRAPLASYTSDLYTYWANGAAMLLRTAMVREIGVFDKNMRFICSDSDYSFTARARGWHIIVAVKARLLHSLDSSHANDNDFINQVKAQDALYFARKWLTGDVYKSLAFEGKTLMPAEIDDVVERLERFLAK